MMKKIILALSVLAACSAGLVSCDNGAYTATPDNTNTTANPIYNTGSSSSGGNFKATVNGSSFSASQAFYQDTTEGTISVLLINGANISSNGASKGIQISLFNYNGAGTYNLQSYTTPNATATADYYNYASATSYSLNVADSGQVIITKDDNNKLSGTFHFVTDSITVTDGTFTDLAKQ